MTEPSIPDRRKDSPERRKVTRRAADIVWRQHVLDQLDDLKKSLWRRWFGVAIALAISGMLLFLVNNRVSDTAQTNTAALCAFRADLQRRVDQGDAFVKDHPGLKSFDGIPMSSIKLTIANQKDSLSALQVLNC